MFVRPHSDIRDPSVVGGKGAGLLKLAALGYRVPEFVVVPAGTDTEDAKFEKELLAATKTFGPCYAVRSSNVREDGEKQSFAGQFDTFLGVKAEDLPVAVRKVAASVVSRHVDKYTAHFKVNGAPMAVIVQKMIEGTVSGVMFTTSPFADDEVLIESVEGRGETLVGGEKTPKKSVLKKNGSATGYLGELLRIAGELEKSEGAPQDIEWTFSDGKLYLLQIRPLTARGDILPEIEDKGWEEYVYRRFCLFCHGVQAAASRSSVQTRFFGFSVPIKEGLIVNCREFYSEQSNDAAIEQWRCIDKGDALKRFARAVTEVAKSTGKIAARIKRTDYSAFSDSQLKRSYLKALDVYIRSYTPLMMRPEEYLEKKLYENAGPDAEAIAVAASVVDKPTFYAREKRDFLSSVIRKAPERYLDRYEWIKSPLNPVFNELSEEDYYARAAKLTAAEAKKRLGEITSKQNELIENRDKVFSRIGDRSVRETADLLNEFVYLRTLTAETSDRFFFYFRKNLLSEAAARFGIEKDELLLMLPEEVSRAFDGFRLTPSEKAKRSSGELIVIENGESRSYYSSRTYSLLKKLRKPSDSERGCILHGEIACPGEITAKVKIVCDFVDSANFRKGDILVASMTTPEITNALDFAAGIITDEGGISCHAAIIAREYAVPCLVGTKYATSLLKDGMTVFLDCINGRVTVLDHE